MASKKSDKHPDNHQNNQWLRPLGNTGLRCHPLGFGCYRVAEGNAEHEAALRAYLEQGGNLIDTSANYADGRSETLVGKLLQDFPREQVIVVTKGGYIQGENMKLALQRKFPEVVEYGEGLWHSIHPEFLETQISRSAARMRQKVIDVYLLHNPEYYLEHQAHHKIITEKDHQEFYRRVQEAFRYLEGKVAEGKIRWYGISSNNYGMASSSRTRTSVSRCWEAAESVAAHHHFRVVQLPMNLYESGGALEANNNGQTVLEFCREKGIGVLLNRPLNAFFGHQMMRLADFLKPGEKPPGKEQLHALLEPLHKMEQVLEDQFDIALLHGDDGGIAHYLEVIVPQIKSSSHWEAVFAEHIVQPIERWAGQCQQLYGGRKEWDEWLRKFSESLPRIFEQIARHLAASQQGASDQLRKQLQQAGYPKTKEPLSRMSQNVLLHLDGVSCVLNGMRRGEYVKDSMGTVELEPVDSLSILSKFRQLNPQEPVRAVH
ncbi:MAG: aldo/keto reductase [Acidobacteria bacterium]|nr:aldo/keto reductase [Acidobacteriota bacterium]